MFKKIWKSICPPKVEIFVWQLLHGRVLMREILKCFGLMEDNNTEYPKCGAAEETIDHLFLHCNWSWNLWVFCMNWWRVSSCTSVSLMSWWFSWSGLCPSRLVVRAWNSLFFALA